MTYLQEQGYMPSLDSAGDVAFKVEGRSYYIAIDEDDLAYFRIVYPSFWEIKDEGIRRGYEC